MLTPVNYVDLFDRLYPEQHLAGLTDDNQITVEELNRRYATIRANQRTMSMAVNAIYAAQPDGAHFRDYMLPFWEVAYTKKYVVGRSEAACMRYVRGYDPAGLDLEFAEPRTALYANDCGSSLLAQEIEFLLFVDGLLVPPSEYVIHPSQGGFAAYVKEDKIEIGSVIRFVVLRKFNQRGRSFERVPAGQSAVPDAPLRDGTPVAHVAFDLHALGHIHDIRYYGLFARKAGDQFYRPATPGKWQAGFTPGYSTALVGLTHELATPGAYDFVMVERAEFWKHEVQGYVAPNDAIWKIDLVDEYGMPAPVYDTADVDVWANGRKLRQGAEYWVEFGSPLFPDIPPRLVFEDVHYGNLHLVAMSGAPRDRESCLEVEYDLLPNQDAIVRLDPRHRKLRLLENVGLVFSSGYLELAGDGIETIADNLALHFDGLREAEEFHFRARFVFSPETLDGAFRQTEVPTVLERFARTVGSIQPDGHYDEHWYNGDFRPLPDGAYVGDGPMDFREGAYPMRRRGVTDFRDMRHRFMTHQPFDARERTYYGDSTSICGDSHLAPYLHACGDDTSHWDLVSIHRRNHPTPPVERGVLPPRSRGQYPAMYFYLRDEYRYISPIVSGGGTGPLEAWRQGPKVNVDCRQKVHGPTVCVSYDFRGEIPAEIPAFPGYTSGAFTAALEGRGDFREGTPPPIIGELAKWVRDTRRDTTLDGRELFSWMSPEYDEYDFRGETVAVADPWTSYVDGAFVEALAGAGDFRDGALAAPAGWAMDESDFSVLDGRELFHWRSSTGSSYDFRGLTVTLPPYEAPIKPSEAFVAALAPTADYRDAAPPAALSQWTVDAAGTVVVDGRDLVYFGSTQSVPLEGREG